jgi:hypothetical protein
MQNSQQNIKINAKSGYPEDGGKLSLKTLIPTYLFTRHCIAETINRKQNFKRKNMFKTCVNYEWGQ